MPIAHLFKFMCDLCGEVKEVYYSQKVSAIDNVRDKGWAVSRNRRKCYCPDCALFVRKTDASCFR